MLKDGVFVIIAISCAEGLLNSNEDVDACESSACSGNAAGTDGSEGCACTCSEHCTKDGCSCKPYVVFSDYSVNATISSLHINFYITPRWRTTEYIELFHIEISGSKHKQVYNNVTLADLNDGKNLPVNGLEPYTPYKISVKAVKTNKSAVFNNTLGTKEVFTANSTAATPKNVIVTNGTRDRATITWEKPIEIGYGVVILYELCCTLANDSATNNLAEARNVTWEQQCEFLDHTYTAYTWVGLPSYLNISFRIRAYTSRGPGNFTDNQTVYTGNRCDPWEASHDIIHCEDMYGLIQSSGPVRVSHNMNHVNSARKWSINLTQFAVWRAKVVFFEEEDDSYNFDGLTRDGSNTNILYPSITATDEQNILWIVETSEQSQRGFELQLEIELDGDDCASSPCLNDGICIDKNYDFECNCTAEWANKSCQTPRLDPDVKCMPHERNVTLKYSIPGGWGNDETIIGGYSCEIWSDGIVQHNATTVGIWKREMELPGLSPFTNYTILCSVKPSKRSAKLLTKNLSCETLKDVPTVPRNVTLLPGNQSIKVSWTPPAEPSGEVTYTVTVNSTDHEEYNETEYVDVTTSITDTVFYIRNLRHYRTYAVVVQVKNSEGTTNAEAVPGRTSPGIPRAVDGFSVIATATQINISWIPQSPSVGETTYDLKLANATANWMNSTDVATFTFTDLMPYTNYSITVTAKTNAGSARPFLKTIETRQYIPSRPRNLYVFPFSPGSNVSVKWETPEFPNGIIIAYTVTWWPGISRNVTDTSYVIQNSECRTINSINVTAWTEVGHSDTASAPVTKSQSEPCSQRDPLKFETLLKNFASGGMCLPCDFAKLQNSTSTTVRDNLTCTETLVIGFYGISCPEVMGASKFAVAEIESNTTELNHYISTKHTFVEGTQRRKTLIPPVDNKLVSISVLNPEQQDSTGLITFSYAIDYDSVLREYSYDLSFDTSQEGLLRTSYRYSSHKPVGVYLRNDLIFDTYGIECNDRGGVVECVSNHTTVFAVLLSVETIAIPRSLKIFAVVAESTSVFFLFVTFVILLRVRKRTGGERIPIQINLSVSLLLLHFWVLWGDIALEIPDFCKAIGVLTHFFLLSSAFWMMNEANLLFFKTSKWAATSTKRSKIVVVTMCIGWGIPFIIAGITAAVGFGRGVYMEKSDYLTHEDHEKVSISKQGPQYNHCLLSSKNGMRLASIIPVAIILAYNLVMAVRAVIFVHTKRAEVKKYMPSNQDEKTKSKMISETLDNVLHLLKVIFLLLPVLGVPWILILLSNWGSESIQLSFLYVNTLVSGLQGVFIFLIYCVADTKVRGATKKSIATLNSMLPSISDSRYGISKQRRAGGSTDFMVESGGSASRSETRHSSTSTR